LASELPRIIADDVRLRGEDLDSLHRNSTSHGQWGVCKKKEGFEVKPRILTLAKAERGG